MIVLPYVEQINFCVMRFAYTVYANMDMFKL